MKIGTLMVKSIAEEGHDQVVHELRVGTEVDVQDN